MMMMTSEKGGSPQPGRGGRGGSLVSLHEEEEAELEAEQEAKGLPYFLAVMGQKGACEGEN